MFINKLKYLRMVAKIERLEKQLNAMLKKDAEDYSYLVKQLKTKQKTINEIANLVNNDRKPFYE